MAYMQNNTMSNIDERPKDVRGIEGSEYDKPAGMYAPTDPGAPANMPLRPEAARSASIEQNKVGYNRLPTDGTMNEPIPTSGVYKDTVLGHCPREEYIKPPRSV